LSRGRKRAEPSPTVAHSIISRRSDLKDLGDLLDRGTSGLLVVAATDVEAKVDAAITRAQKRTKAQLQADMAALKKEIDRAA